MESSILNCPPAKFNNLARQKKCSKSAFYEL